MSLSPHSQSVPPAAASSPLIFSKSPAPELRAATPACASSVSASQYRAALTSTPPSAPGRVLSLDILRAVAILMVLGRHTVAPIAGLGWAEPVVGFWTRIGWAGVDLFFVLSGFLVSGLLFSEFRKTGAVNLRRFVIRRGFKIWPPYLVYIAFVACWLAWKNRHGDATGPWEQLWPNLLHVQNYFHTPRIHTWSLAVEEHFYLGVAFLFYWLLGRRKPDALLRSLPVAIILAVVTLCAVRTWVFATRPTDAVNIYATHLRCDGLLLGTLLAYLSHFRPESLAILRRFPRSSILVGLALALPTLVLAPEANVWTAGIGLAALYVGFALLLCGFIQLPHSSPFMERTFASRPAAWLGAMGFFSYSIYLWHVDFGQTPLHKVALYAAARGVDPGVTYVATTSVYVAVAIATGCLMARLLEKPSLALRDRLFPSEVKALAK